jgi:hypothetical protein
LVSNYLLLLTLQLQQLLQPWLLRLQRALFLAHCRVCLLLLIALLLQLLCQLSCST